MPEQPLVSIVTPTLNQAGLIRETLESVRGQDYPRLEHVVVDGGSTDATLDVLRSCGSALRWSSEPGLAQAAAVNRGWRSTAGEIVGWLNSDDTYLPGAVREAVAFLQAHPEVGVVYGDCDYVDAKGRMLRRYPTRAHDYQELVRHAVNYIPQPAAFVRRRVLEAAGCLDESLDHAMDFDLWLRLGAARIVFRHLPLRLSTMRLHPAAKSVRSLAGFAAELVRVY